MLLTVAVAPLIEADVPAAPVAPFKLVKANVNPRDVAVPVVVTVTAGVPTVLLTVAVAPLIEADIPEAPCGPCAPVAPFSPCGPCAPVAPVAPLAPASPFKPCGIPKVNVLAVALPPIVTVAVAPAANVVALTLVIDAAVPAGPCAPVAPVSPLSPFGPCAPVAPVSPFAPVAPVAPFKLVKANVNPRDELLPVAVTVTAGVPTALFTVAVAPVIEAATPAVPCAPVSPFGIPKIKLLAVVVPLIVTVAVAPAANVVAETPVIDAAVPVGPTGPCIPVSPFAPVAPCAPVAPLGIVKLKTAVLPEFVTVTLALLPAAPVVTVPIDAAFNFAFQRFFSVNVTGLNCTISLSLFLIEIVSLPLK